jgi:hypothetical protein
VSDSAFLSLLIWGFCVVLAVALVLIAIEIVRHVRSPEERARSEARKAAIREHVAEQARERRERRRGGGG